MNSGDSTSAPTKAFSFLDLGGEMGERIRRYDWSATELGPMDSWPRALTTTLSIIMGSRYPMFVWWGPNLLNLYNDSYSVILGKRHPHALGRPAAEAWSEIWGALSRQISIVLEGRGATWDEDLLLIMQRNGYKEETYFTFSYSPVLGDHGEVRGLFCACNETTERVVGERRLAFLRQLAAATVGARTVANACDLTAATLGTEPKDVAFALVYLFDDERRELQLVVRVGIDPQHPGAALRFPLEAKSPWPFTEALAGKPVVLRQLAERIAPSHAGWPEPPTTGILVPLKGAQGHVMGFLIAGASPRLAFDERYQTFFELVAGTLGSAISSAAVLEEDRRRDERFRAFVTASSDAVYRMNAEWTEMHHLQGRDFIADSGASNPDWLEEYIQPEDRPQVVTAIRQAIASKEKFELEHRVIRVDGTIGWTFSRAIPIFDADGDIAEWFGTATDVSVRKQAEEALRESEERYRQLAARLEHVVAERTLELRDKVAELEAFSYSISHDMRGPLRSMQGFAGALLEDYADRLDETGQQYLTRIMRGAQRLDLLVRDVLAYSKVAKGAFALQPIDLEALIREVIQSFQISPATVEVVGPLPPVSGHPALLTQVFSNLLGNAQKFARPGVPLHIRITAAERPDGRVRVAVADNGIGIEPQHFDRIFEIFGRVHADKEYEGTGIGLAIVRKAVERLGGTLGVDSVLDQGTTFWLELARG